MAETTAARRVSGRRSPPRRAGSGCRLPRALLGEASGAASSRPRRACRVDHWSLSPAGLLLSGSSASASWGWWPQLYPHPKGQLPWLYGESHLTRVDFLGLARHEGSGRDSPNLKSGWRGEGWCAERNSQCDGGLRV